MKKNVLFALMLCLTTDFLKAENLSNSKSEEPIKKTSLMLDWFVNPDHAAIIVAKQKGLFKKYKIAIDIIEPSDPSMPPKLVAANQVDFAINYQPQHHMQVDQGLPNIRIGTLVATPLNSLVVLEESGIESLSDLKGKTIGYSISGLEESLLSVMLMNSGVDPKSVKWVNVNWSLSPSLISKKVDAVYGAYRNFELNQMNLENHPGRAFYPEEHGIPTYDELILVANKKLLDKDLSNRLLNALEEATYFTINHPDKAWALFKSYKPDELDTPLNRLAWKDTLPRLALRPRALDENRYQMMAKFLNQNGMIKNILPISDYAISLSVIETDSSK